MRRLHARFDAYWKEAVRTFFPQCIRFFFPSLYRLIDWKRGFEFLNVELRRVHSPYSKGRRPDIVVLVHLKNGNSCLLVVHIEIQVQPDPFFEERMLDYYLHLRLTYNKEVICLAILADSNPNWRPRRLHKKIAQFQLVFEFMTVKLLDLDPQRLEQSRNPIAVITLAHLNALRLRGNPELLFQEKVRMIRKLLEGGYTKRYIAELYAEVDAIMALPKELERQVAEVVREVQRKKRIRRLTSLELVALEEGAKKGLQEGLQQGLQQGLEQGIQQGLQQGLQQGILQTLELRFGAVPEAVTNRLQQITDLQTLHRLHAEAVKAPTLEAFEAVLAQYIESPTPQTE